MISILSFDCFTLKSQTVSVENAKRAAINYYNYKVGKSDNINRISDNEISLITKEETDLYYIVNISKNGFVIISAQSNVYPILAYSTENSFKKTSIPSNVQALLNSYNKQIINATKTSYIPEENIKKAWDSLLNSNIRKSNKSRSVAPLTTSLWDQTPPYSLYCPEDDNGPGGYTLTGCPSTAMAQLMYYYRYPEKGVGTNSYYQYPYGTISADFENATYDYNAMTNVVNTNNYEEVAKLSFHAGVAINTFYGPSVSGVYYMSTVVDGLENHFAYSEDAQLIFKTEYTQEQWESMMREELDMQMPIIYCAVDLIAQGGHTWICDGYDTDDYFHMNFGWGGSYDGYYFLDNISVPGYTFNAEHQMVIDVYPADTNYPAFCTGANILTALDGSFDDGSGPFSYKDNSSCSWLIDTQTNGDSIASISLTIDKFNTEFLNDSLTIYDGDSESSPIITTLSGNDVAGTYTSTGNKMYITFYSNDSITNDGWVISYESNLPNYCNGLVEITDDYGTITDGSGDFNYTPNSICMWSVVPYMASSVTANFVYFETEENCDILKIYDDNVLIGSYSGNTIPPEVTAESGKLFIEFTSNSINNYKGWEIEYNALGVGVEEKANKNLQFKVFPNPTDGMINLHFDDKIIEGSSILMHDVFGKLVLENQITDAQVSSNIQLNCSLFTPGIYLITVKNETQTHTNKVVIE